MKALRSIVGYMFAVIYVFAVWGMFESSYGIIGGWLAALFIIGPLWFVNHYLGLIPQDDSNSFVDMGLAIGVGGIIHGSLTGNGLDSFISSLPTIITVIVGATIGGALVASFIKDMEV